MWSFVTGFFYLAQCFQCSSTLIAYLSSSFLLWPNKLYCMEILYSVYLFICWSTFVLFLPFGYYEQCCSKHFSFHASEEYLQWLCSKPQQGSTRCPRTVSIQRKKKRWNLKVMSYLMVNILSQIWEQDKDVYSHHVYLIFFWRS